MFFKDYERAFEILKGVIDVSSFCLEKVTHSNDCGYVIFITNCPDLRYLVNLKSGVVLKKHFIEYGMFKYRDIVEQLN